MVAGEREPGGEDDEDHREADDGPDVLAELVEEALALALELLAAALLVAARDADTPADDPTHEVGDVLRRLAGDEHPHELLDVVGRALRLGDDALDLLLQIERQRRDGALHALELVVGEPKLARRPKARVRPARPPAR